jgi:hypothetical protein
LHPYRNHSSGPLVVLHTFAGDHTLVRVRLPRGSWRVQATLTGTEATVSNGLMTWIPNGTFDGEVVLLTRSTVM